MPTRNFPLLSFLMGKVLDFIDLLDCIDLVEGGEQEKGREEKLRNVVRAIAYIAQRDNPHTAPVRAAFEATDSSLAHVAEGDMCLPSGAVGDNRTYHVSAHHAVWDICERLELLESLGESWSLPIPWLVRVNTSQLRARLIRERERILHALKQTPPAATPPSHPKGRGRAPKHEADNTRLLIVDALMIHHDYQEGSIRVDTPATLGEVAELAKLSRSTVCRFFKRIFKKSGYKGYHAACVRGEMGINLALWQGTMSTERLAPLLPHESGQEDDE